MKRAQVREDGVLSSKRGVNPVERDLRFFDRREVGVEIFLKTGIRTGDADRVRLAFNPTGD